MTPETEINCPDMHEARNNKQGLKNSIKKTEKTFIYEKPNFYRYVETYFGTHKKFNIALNNHIK